MLQNLALVSTFAGTFDIQNASAVISTDRKIEISAQFISGTRARGAFIVFRCINKTCWEFRAVQRPGPNTTVTDTISNLPPAAYNVSFHDLEESGLPNTSPAYEQSESVIVAAKGEEGKSRTELFSGYHIIVHSCPTILV